ncbi:MAG: WD40 repeat domain-containing protein [Pseudomonadota bacterium]
MLAHKTLELGAPATGCGFSGLNFVASAGDGRLHFLAADGEQSHVQVHDGAILALATDERTNTVFSAGDDGRVVKLGDEGDPETIHDGRKWVDSIALSQRGDVAWSAGKAIFLLRKGSVDPVQIAAPSSVANLAFSHDGKLLGAAVYGGALIISVSGSADPRMLEWQGSHKSIGFSVDGRFCVTSMLENALHVWRLDKPEDHHGKMGGYHSRPSSFAWTADGRFMATAGADVLVLWPFTGAKGPLGAPAAVFQNTAKPEVICSVASRPQSQHIALGYKDGSLFIFDRKRQNFTPIVEPGEAGPVAKIAFNQKGNLLGFIREDGEAGVIDVRAL